MSQEIDREFLREEYFHLQKTVEDFDQRTLMIKNWSVTVSIAAIGTAFTQKTAILLLLASGSALLFWCIEVLWKSFQQANYKRIEAIKNFMRGNTGDDFSSPEINRYWSWSWKERSFSSIIWWPHVCLPHAIIFLLGIVLWVLNSRIPIVPT